MSLSSKFGKEAINSASDLLLPKAMCLLLSFRALQSHLLVPLEKARRVKLCEVPFLQDRQDNRP